MPIPRLFPVAAVFLLFLATDQATADRSEMATHSFKVGRHVVRYNVDNNFDVIINEHKPYRGDGFVIYGDFMESGAFGAPKYEFRVYVTNANRAFVDYSAETLARDVDEGQKFESGGGDILKNIEKIGKYWWYHVRMFDSENQLRSDLYFTRLGQKAFLQAGAYYFGRNWFWQSSDKYANAAREVVRGVEITRATGSERINR